MVTSMQFDVGISGADALEAAITRVHKTTGKTTRNVVTVGAYEFTRSAGARTKKAPKNRKKMTGSRGGEFYRVYRRRIGSNGKKYFDVYLPKGKTRRAIARRKEVRDQYKQIKLGSYGKQSWRRMNGAITRQTMGLSDVGNRKASGNQISFPGFKDPSRRVKAIVKGFRSLAPTIMLENKTSYLQDIAPGIVEASLRAASLSMLRKGDKDLKDKFRRSWGEM